MIVQHNIMALNSYNKLSSNNTQVSKNLEKLSSGYKINRAGDDAAGLAISEKMRAQITGLERASSNALDGISLVQTAEGALTEVHSMLNRMVELATQSSNGTYDNETDRANLQKEVQSLKDEIDRIAESTNFNGINLLDGSMGSGTTGVKGAIDLSATGKVAAFTATVTGAPKDYEVEFKAVASGTSTDGITASWSGTKLTLSIEGTGTKTFTQDDIDTAIKNASGAPDTGKNIKVTIEGGKITTTGNTAAQTATALKTAEAKLAESKVAGLKNVDSGDANFKVTATKAGNVTNKLVITATPTDEVGAKVSADGNVALNLDSTKQYSASEINSMLGKAGAAMTVSFDGKMNTTELAKVTGADATHGLLAGGAGAGTNGGLNLQIGDTKDQRIEVLVGNMSSTALNLGGVNVSTESGAADSMSIIKTAINTVSSTRADLGAIQNRLEHTVNNLATTTENLTSAESRIRDTDMAKEMMAFTKNNVLSQAAQAMLAQANQQPQQVLQLLR